MVVEVQVCGCCALMCGYGVGLSLLHDILDVFPFFIAKKIHTTNSRPNCGSHFCAHSLGVLPARHSRGSLELPPAVRLPVRRGTSLGNMSS